MKVINALFKTAVTLFCFLWIMKEVVVPGSVAMYTYDKFIQYVQKCDTAMNSSWYLKDTVSDSLRKSEMVQMLDCHEYDKLRKVMLLSGLSEDYLAYLGLKALELNQRSINDLAEPHRFQER